MNYNYNYANGTAGAGAAAVFGAFALIWGLIGLAILVLVIAGMWKIFTKAGQPGWAAIIPIYNIYVLLQIVGRPTWWLAFLLLAFVPVVGGLALWLVYFVLWWDLAKSFGKDVGYAVGLWLLSFVFVPMLGFGSAQYLGPMASGFGLPEQPGGGPGGYRPPGGGYTPPAPGGYAPPPAPPTYTPPTYTPPAPPAPPAAPVAPPAPPAPPAAPEPEPPASPTPPEAPEA